ncbi:serine/threonine protein kinase [Stigmatella sp. ncwal1]|uniref:Serine/threonine protein kinase n=1 Tax=Stigmatella ashevillensis TaxID=2995309 RepID=A0ABT5D3S1_9BACT|nr:serine/threonine-protein kinase [Stigmatella ashevillena]MDC0707493.1 serine/threonine protein kinase [Stigmatella ashevillena]
MPSPSVEPEALAVWQQGLTVGRYSLLTRLAVGGMAEIWLARQVGPKGFEKFIVIKRILDGLGTEPEFVGMFLDEARLAAQLNHPNIVQIFDLGEESGAFYIAMEYLPGENLASVVRAGLRQGRPLPIPFAVRIIASAAEGLAYAHAKTGPDGALLGIVHRDVSPQNLLVTYDGVVKVLDFGIAKAATRESQTLVGQVKGKASYMSPEQARGLSLDARSDIFSLGVILFEMVTHSRLFKFAEPLVALQAVASEEPIPLARARNPEVPEALGHIIAQALARQPGQRYPTARHFQSALEEWLRGQNEATGSAELADYMSQVFGDRIQERARLLEAARSGELTSSSARRVAARSSSMNTLPEPVPQAEEETTLEQPWLQHRRLRLAGVAAVVLAVGVGAGVALLSARRMPAEPVAVAAPAPPVLTIETDPPGARLMVDGKDVGRAPVSLDTLALGEHKVAASLEGRVTAERRVKLAHPGERAMVVLSLAAVPVPPAAEPLAQEKDGPAAASPPRVSKRAPGRLTLDTTPWTHVFLRGRKLGDTPLIDQSLPVGRHQLKLVNESKNISTVIEVEIRSGQSTVKKLRL